MVRYNHKRLRSVEESQVQGKVVLVTGGAKRVGAAVCRCLHAAGARVVIHYHHSTQEAHWLQAELNAQRPESAMVTCADLLDLPALPTLISAVLEHFGRLDALVNNASSFYPTPLAQANQQQWDDLLGTNLRAPLFLAQAAAEELQRRNGCIVSIADIHAERPMQGHLLYSVAKAGLVALTRGLAQEMAPHVRVNAVAPGVILWPESAHWQNQAQRDDILSHTLLKREGSPDDIARTVQFLINDAPYITGQVIAVDGGRSIHI